MRTGANDNDREHDGHGGNAQGEDQPDVGGDLGGAEPAEPEGEQRPQDAAPVHGKGRYQIEKGEDKVRQQEMEDETPAQHQAGSVRAEDCSHHRYD
jgi:hypothetical protein